MFKFFSPASLFNNAGTEGVSLDFDGIAGSSGDTDVLKLDLGGLTALAPGSETSFLGILAGDKPGAYAASYKLKFSDADIGAPDTRFDYYLTVNLEGQVVPVPEPGSWALMLAGLGGLAWAGRRKRPPG